MVNSFHLKTFKVRNNLLHYINTLNLENDYIKKIFIKQKQIQQGNTNYKYLINMLNNEQLRIFFTFWLMKVSVVLMKINYNFEKICIEYKVQCIRQL